MAPSMRALIILSRFSLLYKRISVSWALFKTEILGTIQLTYSRGSFVINSVEHDEYNEIKFQYLHHNGISD